MKPEIRDKEFEATASKMISKKKDVAQVKRALEIHRNYLRYMSEAFLEEADDDCYTFRASYRLKRPVWREIQMSGRQTLADLAVAIIEYMNWADDHLHAFSIPDEGRFRIFGKYGIYHQDAEDAIHPTFKTKDVMVSQIDWKKYPVLGFVFDFGDGHEFDVTLKERAEAKDGKEPAFPLLVDQRGVGPEQYPDDDEEDPDSENFFFDDCAICSAQKNALQTGRSMTEDELVELFHEAKVGKHEKK